MIVAVESASNMSLDLLPETQCSKIANDSGLSLPNVVVTPPEEEFDTPPWCCFDADKDALPGAFVYDEYANEDFFDYSAHAEDEIFGSGVGSGEARGIEGSEEREDVFVMRSLVQEAEHLKEQLKALQLSTGTRSSSIPSRDEDEQVIDVPVDMPTSPTSSVTQPEQTVKRRKSLFSFKTMGRKKTCEEELPSMPPPSDLDHVLGPSLMRTQDADAASIRSARTTASWKSGFFSRFKFTSKKSAVTEPEDISDARKSISACQSHEDLSSQREQDMVLKRRYSIFDLSRRQSTVPPQPVISTLPASSNNMARMNQSSSSLSTSSVPLTPDGAVCILDSPPASPTEKSNGRIASVDTSLLSSMDVLAVDNLAESLALPSTHTIVSDGTFSLDPLHFESLQFDSDDFA